jgi:predicted PurR-regulated permease PerM
MLNPDDAGAPSNEVPRHPIGGASAQANTQNGDAQSARYGWPQIGTFLLVAVAALHFARPLLLPIVLAVLLNLLLSPAARLMRQAGLPLPLGAAVMVVMVLAAVGTAVWQLAEPAADWFERAPRSLKQMQQKIRPIKQSVEQVQKATQQAEQAAQVADVPAVREVKVKGPTLLQQLITHAQDFVVGGFTMLVLLYFLIASDEFFLRKFVRVVPRLRDRIRAVEIGRTIEREIGHYFVAYTLINAAVGTVVAVALHLLGIPNPFLWGLMVAVLNFVPYLGPVISFSVICVVSLLTFDSLQQAIWPPIAYLVIEGIEGNLVQPLVFGRRLALNPVAIFVSLLFWGWLWGVAGILLAVPILIAAKVACGNIDSLNSIAGFLERK